MYLQTYLEEELAFYCRQCVVMHPTQTHISNHTTLCSACSIHKSQCCDFIFSATSQITVSLCFLLQGDYERPLRDGSPQVMGGDTYPRGPLKQPQSHTKPPGYPPAHLPYPPVFHHYKPSPYHHPPSQPSPPYTPQVQYARCVHSYKWCQTLDRCSSRAVKILLLSSENLVSPNLVSLNYLDKLKCYVFLNDLRNILNYIKTDWIVWKVHGSKAENRKIWC